MVFFKGFVNEQLLTTLLQKIIMVRLLVGKRINKTVNEKVISTHYTRKDLLLDMNSWGILAG